jgi:hypothetical protein
MPYFNGKLSSSNVHPMQVPQVTEQVAIAVIESYPTVLSLARAYSMLVSPLILLTLTRGSYKYQSYIQYLLVFRY